MPAIWLTLLVRLAVLAGAGIAIGWLYSSPLLGVIGALCIALAWQLVWLYRLDRWLNGTKMRHLPEGEGIWPRIFARIDFLNGRARRRGKQFKALLKQMRQATRAFPDGAIIVSVADEIVYMNRNAEDMLGLKRKADRGLRVENLVRNPDFVAYLHAGAQKTAVEFASPMNSGRWLSCHQVPYGLDQRLLLIRDITPQRQADQMRQDFVANASHELRTPLTVITGYLDALAEDDSLTDDLRGPVAEMQRQSGRMRNLVNELLRLSELESQGPESAGGVVNIQALMAASGQEAQARPNCPKEIKISSETSAHLSADEADIQSILTNLVSNAVRYTPVDGRIEISWLVDETGGHLTVADNGVGIASEHLPRLTERFYRVEDGRERIGGDGGTGLGLAIVKHALQRYSATLDIESQPGAGARFTCNFPRDRIVTVS